VASVLAGALSGPRSPNDHSHPTPEEGRSPTGCSAALVAIEPVEADPGIELSRNETAPYCDIVRVANDLVPSAVPPLGESWLSEPN
jgi:LDH2 family malate/lactate/ureidoglycolate dehydrogenase